MSIKDEIIQLQGELADCLPEEIADLFEEAFDGCWLKIEREQKEKNWTQEQTHMFLRYYLSLMMREFYKLCYVNSVPRTETIRILDAKAKELDKIEL